MLGRLIAFIASRFASRAIDAVERRLVWSAIGGLLFAAACVFGLMFAFWVLQSEIGAQKAAGILAAGCLVLAIIGFWMPSILNWAERQAESTEDESTTAEEASEAVDEAAHAAVDYLGSLQVVASAFMVGLSAGRSMRGDSASS